MVAVFTVVAIVVVIVLVRVFNNVHTGNKWYDQGSDN